jgi:hypothetical protein
VTSPTSSGPAGSHFEGQVGAYFLLAMLAGAEARGLPGCTIDQIRLQGMPEGHSLRAGLMELAGRIRKRKSVSGSALAAPFSSEYRAADWIDPNRQRRTLMRGDFRRRATGLVETRKVRL